MIKTKSFLMENFEDISITPFGHNAHLGLLVEPCGVLRRTVIWRDMPNYVMISLLNINFKKRPVGSASSPGQHQLQGAFPRLPPWLCRRLMKHKQSVIMTLIRFRPLRY